MHGSTATAGIGFAHPVRNISELRVEPGMKTADFGAGSGAYTLAIAGALSGTGMVYAIDVQRDLLRRIKNETVARKLKNVETIWSDLEKPGGSKLADTMLDLVLMSNILFQLADKKAALAEAHRTLKNDGRLCIIDWSASFRGTGPRQEDVVEKGAAVSLAEEAGFRLAREFPAGAHHYGLIFHKK